MKTILLVSDSYPPEIRSASHLMQELAIGLKEKGFDIIVATSYPQYNLADDAKNKIYEEYSIEYGVKIIRIKTLPHHKVNFIIRGISQITMPYIFFSRIKRYVKDTKIDVVIVYSPPLPLSIVGEKIKKIYRARYLLNVQDLFPQNAIDLGVLNNSLLIKFFESMEKKAYLNADIVTFHSEGNLDFVSNKYKQYIDKFKILHNWIDVNEFDGVKKSGIFRKKFELKDRFVILFAGVMGPSQGLDFVIQLADRVKDLEEICFLFVGDGMEKDKLEKKVQELNLKNVMFKPFVSKNEYPALVKDCDVGLVSLTNKNKTPVVPGKILGYMAAGVPILAFLNNESDGHKIIQSAQCGYSCVWGDLKEAENVIRKMFEEKKKLSDLGKNGYDYVKSNFSKDKIINEMLEYIHEIDKKGDIKV